MDMPATYAAELALNRQNIAMSVIKASAQQQEMVAKILEESVRSAPVVTSRGTNLNTSV